MSGLQFGKPEPRAKVRARAKRLRAKDDRAVYQAVTARDCGLCRCCGRAGTDRHHLVFRSQGGATSISNVLLLCHEPCHLAVHARRLRIEGTDANTRLRFVWEER